VIPNPRQLAPSEAGRRIGLNHSLSGSRQGGVHSIVEDNATLRAALTGVLEILNYKVLETADGGQAAPTGPT
jgi:hypothetical protein